MKLLLLFIASLCLSTPCLAKTNLWQGAEGKIGQTIELKEHHAQHCIRTRECFGLMDRAGKIKPLPDCRIIGIDSHGWIAVRVPNKQRSWSVRKLLGSNGQLIPRTDKLEAVNFLKEKRAPVRVVPENPAQTGTNGPGANSFSYCTETGEVLASRFDQVSPFSDHVAAVRIGKSVGFIGLDGQFLPNSKMVECQFLQGISQGYLAACANGRWGYLDIHGNWLVEPKFESAEPFNGDFALVHPDNSNSTYDKSKCISYIDKTGKLFDMRFHSGKAFEEGYAAVTSLSNEKNAKPLWGLIDRSGQWAVEPKYTWIGPVVGLTRLLYDRELVGIFFQWKNCSASKIPPHRRVFGRLSIISNARK